MRLGLSQFTSAWLMGGLVLLMLPARVLAVDVNVDRTTKYQTIDGLGFFGAMDTWWGAPSNMVSDAWAAQVLGDLGISMWRNEYYPPADSLSPQDADWNKQKPVIQTLKRIADANQIPLRVLLTVWSPPSSMKCTAQNGSPFLPIEGTAPRSTKNGNTLCKNSWDDFATWLIAGLQLYKDIGVDVFGLSFQNEPYFWQGYNSCFYVQPYYAQTLAYIGPKIKAAFPKVKLFGAENMLAMEAGASKDYFYVGEIKNNNAAGASALDVIAVHGYNDGVVPTASSQMSTLWSTASTSLAQPMNKPLWMTETSGYVDTWTAGTGADGKAYPGASDLAYSMYAAFYFGHASAWVWWQGSELNGFSVSSLMAGTKSLSKRYYVSKQFYRFIRPGATMVKVTSADSAVLAAAFEHAAMGSFTTILINSSSDQKTINLTGANVPATLSMYTTSATDNCASKGTVNAASITLLPNTVNTLVDGNVYESGSPVIMGTTGTGGGAGSGGMIGTGGATGNGGTTGSGGSGGRSGTGGRATTGGFSGSGVAGSAGAVGTNSATSSGGMVEHSGGSAATDSGGSAGSAGSVPTSSGGLSGSGSADAAAGGAGRTSCVPNASSSRSTGCSCRVYGMSGADPTVLVGLGLAALGFLRSKKRR